VIEQVEDRLGSSLGADIGLARSEEEINEKTRVIDADFQGRAFLPSDDVLKYYLAQVDHWSEAAEEVRRQIAHRKPIVAHVRLGDYTNLQHLYGFDVGKYYRTAYRLCIQMDMSGPVLLFSDDPDRATRLFSSIGIPHELCTGQDETSSVETLRMMASGGSLITANSTYSWWAAEYGRLFYGLSRVVLPNRFTTRERLGFVSDLTHPDWTIVSLR